MARTPPPRHGKPPPRNDHVPTEQSRAFAKAMAIAGVTREQIAKVIGISPNTLVKHYKAELDTGSYETLAAVSQSLVKKALGNGMGATAAAIFFLKTRGNVLTGGAWRDKEAEDAARQQVIVVSGVPRPGDD
jgi:DNA-binding XRE family transcriptional regulator